LQEPGGTVALDAGRDGLGVVGEPAPAITAHVIDQRHQRLALLVRAYSTRGGTSGKVWRATMPSASSARSRSESVRGLIPQRALELAEAAGALGEVTE